MSIRPGFVDVGSYHVQQLHAWDVGIWDGIKFYESDDEDEQFANALQAARGQPPLKPTMNWLMLRGAAHRRHETRKL